jgi:hypothetical protein
MSWRSSRRTTTRPKGGRNRSGSASAFPKAALCYPDGCSNCFGSLFTRLLLPFARGLPAFLAADSGGIGRDCNRK